ncbi:hypothetical protein IAT40_003714 [Kwoniella sp. CBS 6097]
MSTEDQCIIKVHQLFRGSDDGPIVGSPFETTLKKDEQLATVFSRWHEKHETKTPAEQLEWLFFPFGDPNTESTVHVPAPLHEEQTPNSLKLPKETKIYVKLRSEHVEYTHTAVFSQS